MLVTVIHGNRSGLDVKIISIIKKAGKSARTNQVLPVCFNVHALHICICMYLRENCYPVMAFGIKWDCGRQSFSPENEVAFARALRVEGSGFCSP